MKDESEEKVTVIEPKPAYQPPRREEKQVKITVGQAPEEEEVKVEPKPKGSATATVDDETYNKYLTDCSGPKTRVMDFS